MPVSLFLASSQVSSKQNSTREWVTQLELVSILKHSTSVSFRRTA